MPPDSELKFKVDKLFTDVYVGKDADNPPLTMRLDRLERTYNRIMGISTAVLIAVLAELVRGLMSSHH